VVYADFECMLLPLAGCLPSKSSITNVSKHVPISYGYVVVDQNNETVSDKYYFGTDAVENFIDSMIKVGEDFRAILEKPKRMALTVEEQASFAASEVCHYCKRKFKENNKYKKVRDHCHWTGEYRGAAHACCNLNAREIRTIPVCFHGLGNYDSHLLLMAAERFPCDISIIARNAERFQSFNVELYEKAPKVALRFIDSFNFLSTSLATLVENYKNSGGAFNI
jgi:hypothetical protein